jgi:iron complex outermembrane receptor protein
MTKVSVKYASTLRASLMGGVAMFAFAGLPATVHAQDAGVAAEDEEMGDVIIVQARRQNESLQEVPVTVTAIGGEVLEKYGVDQVADVVGRVPTLNVQVGGSGSGGQLSLRGVGSSNISASFDSAVAFDFDGVQVSTMRLVQAGFFDTEQIDVLKGPQSLFFGKSASAGVFSIRSANPTSTWEIGAKASYEFEEEGYVIGGYISGPLSETLGVRLAAQYNDIDKLVELAPNTPAVNLDRGQTNIVARATLAWDPTPGFDANLKVQYVKNEGDGAIQHSDINCGPNGVADPVFLLSGGLVIPSNADCNDSDGLYHHPDSAPQLAPGAPTPSEAEGRNGVPFNETEVWFTRLSMNVALSDNLTLTSTTGYLDMDAVDYDCYAYVGILGPGVPGGAGCSDPVNTLEQFTQELRLTTDFDGPANFMFGAFYEDRTFVFDTAQQAVNISFLAADPITGFTYDWDKVHTTDTEAFSVFGSVIFDLTDNVELSGGVRYTDEEKSQVIDVPYLHLFLQGPGFVAPGFSSGPIDFSDSNWSPEATIKYRASDDVNIFASFKTGFKSGGIDNSALPSASLSAAAASGNFDSLIYGSETAIGGEIGIKSQLADRTITLNATAYHYVFDDLQVQNFDAVNIQFQTLNAGEVTSKGLDIEFGWDAGDGLSVSSNFAYLDASFSDTFVAGLGQDLDGRKVARAPKFSGNLAVDYAMPINDALEMTLSGNAIYSDSYFTNEDTLTDLRQSSYLTFDASVSVGDVDGAWKLSLIGTNLRDELWVNTSGGRPFLQPGVGDDLVVTQNRGRQVYVEASFKF